MVLEIYMWKTTVWPFVLFLVMEPMFFDGAKIPTIVQCRIPQETFIPSLVPIGQVVSEKKSLKNC